MIKLLTILGLLVFLVQPQETPQPTAPTPTVENTPPATVPKKVRPQRVHLLVNDVDEVSGTLIEEDEILITIRNRFGKIESYPKIGLIHIVRLNELSGPQPGKLILRNGDVISGTLIRDDFEKVIIEIQGVRTPYPREVVWETIKNLTPRQEYEAAKKRIKPEQHIDRLNLARWLYSKEMYRESKLELESLLITSKLPDAIELLNIVNAQILLERDPAESSSANERSPRGRRESDVKSGPVDLRDLLPSKILDPDDVNIMRVYEIDFKNPPKLYVSPESIREVLEKYGDSNLIPSDSSGRTRLFRADPLEIARLIFKLKARDLYSRIEVNSEPSALNQFRLKVHDGWLIPNCATSRCHGGIDAGRFFLHRRGSKTDKVRYTNLLILERWNELERPLINYERPADSLLIQYALPRKEARFPHPDVKGFRPVFSRSNQRLLQATLDWINSMYQPRTRYPVKYDPPVLDSPDGDLSGNTDSRETR